VDWQLPLVILAVAVAAGYLGRRAWRTWKGRGCGGCGAAKAESSVTLVPADELRFRKR
jgi:hypothetical protein